MDRFSAEIFAENNRFRGAKAQAVGLEAIYQAKAELEGELAAVRTKVLDAAESGDLAPFLDAVKHFRFALFRDTDFLALAEKIDDAALGGSADASKQLSAVLDALSVGSGRYKKLKEEDKERIASNCAKWLPICQKLNKAFKRLWKEPLYTNSKLVRKEARGSLAEKHKISMADVEAIQSYLSTPSPSQQTRKRTPWEAMLRMVARQYPGIGEKTVENIYREWRKEQE